jgi:hypothetical protein
MSPRPVFAAFALSICSVNAAFNVLSGFDDMTRFSFDTSERCITALYVYILKYYLTEHELQLITL